MKVFSSFKSNSLPAARLLSLDALRGFEKFWIMNKTNYRNLIILIPGICLLVYIVLRAYYLSFIHDECLSFTLLSGNPTWKNTANNHFINTYLMGICNGLFGSHELALRLPNILSFILYFGCCFYIIKPSKNTFLYILGTVVLLLNPFFIDFFSLARGYGLSMGFMMLSLYFIFQHSFIQMNYKTFIKNCILSLICGGLAIYSNLSMINYYIACVLIYIIIFLLFLRKNHDTSLLPKLIFVAVIIISAVPLFYAINRLLNLDEQKQLYYGAVTLKETVYSIISATFYFSKYPSWVSTLLFYTFIFSFPIAIVSIIIKKDFWGKLSLVTCLIIILISGTIIEHLLFSSKYPIERTGLFLIPIYGLFIYYLAIHIFEFYRPSKAIYIPVILVLCAPVFYHFLANVNLKYTKTWAYDAHTKTVMKIIDENTRDLQSNASISNTSFLEPSINFYITTRKIKINLTDRRGVNLNSDFLYRYNDNSSPEHFKVLFECHDKNVNASLLMKTETDR